MKRIELEPQTSKEKAKKTVIETLRRIREDTGATYYDAGKEGGLRRESVWYILNGHKDVTASTFLQLLTGLGCKVTIEYPGNDAEMPRKTLNYRDPAERTSTMRGSIRYRLRKQGVRVEGDVVYLTPDSNISMRRIATMICYGFKVVNVDEDGNPVKTGKKGN